MNFSLKKALILFTLPVVLFSCVADTEEIHDQTDELQKEQSSTDDDDRPAPESENTGSMDNSISEADKSEMKSNQVEGTYNNENGGILTITNLHTNSDSEQVFDYHFVHEGSQEDCQGINYNGSSVYDGDLHAKTMDGDDVNEAFEFDASFDFVIFEPAIESIGMGCARVITTRFSKK